MVSSQERRQEVEERGGGVGVREGRERQVCTEHRCMRDRCARNTGASSTIQTQTHIETQRDTDTYKRHRETQKRFSDTYRDT